MRRELQTARVTSVVEHLALSTAFKDKEIKRITRHMEISFSQRERASKALCLPWKVASRLRTFFRLTSNRVGVTVRERSVTDPRRVSFSSTRTVSLSISIERRSTFDGVARIARICTVFVVSRTRFDSSRWQIRSDASKSAGMTVKSVAGTPDGSVKFQRYSPDEARCWQLPDSTPVPLRSARSARRISGCRSSPSPPPPPAV